MCTVVRKSNVPSLADIVGCALRPWYFPGKARVVDGVGRVLSSRWPESTVTLGKRVQMRLQLADRIQRLMWGGVYEQDLVRLLRGILSPGMVVIDVGAHVGYFSLVAAACVGASGRVLAFEADPDIFQRLQDNVAPYPWVCAHHLAIADRSGSLTFYRSPCKGESGWGSLFNGGEGREQVQVVASTLDEQVQVHRLKRVDVVKVDVEGAEVRVLQGSSELLRRYRPVWVLEINAVCLARDNWRPEDVGSILREARYRLSPDGSAIGRRFTTVVAVPEERHTIGAEKGYYKHGR